MQRATHVALGSYHTLVKTSSGDTWAWGNNLAAELGLGEMWMQPAKTPQRWRAEHGPRLVGVDAGWRHCVGITESGEAHVWGWNGAYYGVEVEVSRGGVPRTGCVEV